MPDLTTESRRMCSSNRFWECEVPGSSGTYTVRFEEIFGQARQRRMCTHDWTCTCAHFRMKLHLIEGSYCKHVGAVMWRRCGWHEDHGGGLDPSPLSKPEREAAEAEGRCPSCGGEAEAVRVAV